MKEVIRLVGGMNTSVPVRHLTQINTSSFPLTSSVVAMVARVQQALTPKQENNTAPHFHSCLYKTWSMRKNFLSTLSELFCVAGGSMGGMQTLQWSVGYPDIVKNCIILASASEHSAQQIAFNEVGRQAILSDPNWNNGEYGDNPPRKGLALARMVGHVTYLSDELMREKFGRKPPRGNIKNTDFAVGSYLIYQGETFVDRFDANSYIYVTKALDHFSLGRGEELTLNLARAKANFLIIAFSSDWLYPPYQSREIVKSLEVNAIPVTYCEVNFSKGHDSFLVPNPEQHHLIHHFLEFAQNFSVFYEI